MEQKVSRTLPFSGVELSNFVKQAVRRKMAVDGYKDCPFSCMTVYMSGESGKPEPLRDGYVQISGFNPANKPWKLLLKLLYVLKKVVHRVIIVLGLILVFGIVFTWIAQ